MVDTYSQLPDWFCDHLSKVTLLSQNITVQFRFYREKLQSTCKTLEGAFNLKKKIVTKNFSVIPFRKYIISYCMRVHKHQLSEWTYWGW